MAWYWIALILGVIAPWIVMGSTIRLGFLRGPIEGFGVWFGISLVTVPFMFAFMWAAQLLF